MPRLFNAILRSPATHGVLVLLLLSVASFQLRDGEFKQLQGAPGIIATYHTLLTITALDESPVQNHWFLPSVTLGRDIDKYIPWGATVATRTGDDIYTSFYSPGFVVPYLGLKALHADISAHNLALFNGVLGGVSVLILFFLLNALLRYNGFSPVIASAAAVVAGCIGIFSREALLSHGVTYWCHSLYQPLLMGSLLCYLTYLTSTDERRRQISAAGLLVLTLLGPLTEWSGYVFNAGLVLLLWFNNRSSADSRALAIKVGAVTVLAMAMMLTHLMLVLGPRHTLGALLLRFKARNAVAGSLPWLLEGYGQSYGLYLIVLLIILAIAGFSRAQYRSPTARRTTLCLFLAALIPLAENLLLLQHATSFSFDRLKFIPAAAILIALAFAHYRTSARAVLTGVILIAAAQNYRTYRSDIEQSASWGQVDRNNQALAASVLKRIDPDCSVFASEFEVRGYANLLFHHGIYENTSAEQAVDYLHARHGCALVYLEGFAAFEDLPAYTRASILRDTEAAEIIELPTLVAIGQTTKPNTRPAAMPWPD